MSASLIAPPPLVAFIGKGGTGKTTLAALYIKHALAGGLSPVLAVDADPNSCLPEAVGLKAAATVGSIKREVLDRSGLSPAGPSVSKTEYCEYALENALVESTGFDMVVMGRPDGEGCYCFVNSVVRTLIERLSRSYRLVVADCEAGLEHLSRRTLGDIHTAFIVSDPSRKGVETAARQVALMREVGIGTARVRLIFNNAPGAAVPEELVEAARRSGASPAGVVRHDDLVCEYEMKGRPLLELPEGCAAYADFSRILDAPDNRMDLPPETR